MASTYSPLKIELIGTGEQAGTWGTTTNTNLGTALEEAITGRATATFPTDANYTLPYTDSNASQVFRNLVLNVTSSGNLSATRDLIVPPIEKQYFVENNTSGGQSIRVKTAAGTGVTIPNGRVVNVYCDGTNVRFADDLTGNLTVGGTVAVTGAATLSSGLAVTGNTTITGTLSPTSTILTGAGTVSVPIIARATDTNTGMYFPAADTIAFTLGGVIVTEFVPAVMSVPNVVRVHGGLGTVADLLGTFQIGRYSLLDGGSTLNTNGGSTFLNFQIEAFRKMYIMDTGRVGIGTGVPNEMVHVATPGNQTMLLADNGVATAFYGTYASGETAFIGNPSFGQLMTTGTTTNTSYRILTNGSERVRVTNTGDVGIGVTPTAKLDVRSSNGIVAFFRTDSGSNDAYIEVQEGDGGESVIFGSALGLGFVGTRTNHSFSIRTNNTEKILVTNTGNVGISVTAPPVDRLTVLGASTGSGSSTVNFRNSGNTELLRIRDDGLFLTGGATFSPYNNTTGVAANVHIGASGELYRSTSSIKYKTEVTDYDKGLNAVMAMRPVYYKDNRTDENKLPGDQRFAGLIAEEIHAAGLQEFVQYNAKNEPDALSYGNMAALFTKAIQELKAELDAVKAELAAMKGN